MRKDAAKYFRVYVVQCTTPGYFYVGSTVRLPYLREMEHREGWGSQWTTKHGFEKMLFMKLVPPLACEELEDALTVWLQARYGYRFVRGGKRTATREKKLQKWLHPCMKNLLPTDVLPLHARPMGKFPSELRRLVNAFEVVCGFENPDHLDADVEA
jgi:predicted GIY-YIG superfamily endonuclease